MKRKIVKSLITALILISVFSANIYSQSSQGFDSSAVDQAKKPLPQWVQDFRDTEIIIFGALPFVTITVTLAYSLVNSAMHNWDSSYFINPFTKEGSFTIDQQVGIIVTSACVCLGIGLTNLTINLIKRNIQKKKNKTTLQSNVKITEIENTTDLILMPERNKRPDDYLYGNIESAVF